MLALFAWAFAGFVFGFLGVLLCWFIVRKQPSKVKSDAIWASVAGVGILILVEILYMMLTGDSILTGSPVGTTTGSSHSAW